MLQLVYVSSARGQSPVDLEALLEQARSNNERDEITGLLYTDGHRFLQALEGPKVAVEDAFLRIIADPRHHALVLLSRRETTRREFGNWSMAQRSPAESHDDLSERIMNLCRNAAPSVQGTFSGLIDARRDI